MTASSPGTDRGRAGSRPAEPSSASRAEGAAALTAALKAEAQRVGFDLVGVADVRPSDHAAFYRAWLEAGRHGSMAYLAREDAVARRLSPDGFRSAVVVALNYYPGDDDADDAGADDAAADDAGAADAARGIIARYARGRDYHRVIRRKLLALLSWLEAELGRELPLARAYVDTGPVLERELAQRAGLGWFGRSTMLLNPRRGSYFFLGSLLLDIELVPDAPFDADHCGTCSACVSACPTGALLGRDAAGAPVMDATRCISYLTIENRGAIPRELRPLMGNRVFGCDICQEVCPWNGGKFVRLTGERDFDGRERERERLRKRKRKREQREQRELPSTTLPSLISLMRMTQEEWDEWTQGSAIRRAGYAGLKRNVAVALGNWGSAEAVPVLAGALRELEPIVRSHAAWALGQIGTAEALDAVRDALTLECDEGARAEMMAALGLRSRLLLIAIPQS
jgi:epoxyqueuosine reductase